jgi:hypothetical protein
LTAQGHPIATFDRAIERGNLRVAETVLGELGRPTLLELLDLTALIAEKDVGRQARLPRDGCSPPWRRGKTRRSMMLPSPPRA